MRWLRRWWGRLAAAYQLSNAQFDWPGVTDPITVTEALAAPAPTAAAFVLTNPTRRHRRWAHFP